MFTSHSLAGVGDVVPVRWDLFHQSLGVDTPLVTPSLAFASTVVGPELTSVF